jgi:hypothetical protein
LQHKAQPTPPLCSNAPRMVLMSRMLLCGGCSDSSKTAIAIPRARLIGSVGFIVVGTLTRLQPSPVGPPRFGFIRPQPAKRSQHHHGRPERRAPACRLGSSLARARSKINSVEAAKSSRHPMCASQHQVQEYPQLPDAIGTPQIRQPNGKALSSSCRRYF